jgi:hypothetical protein
MVNYVRDTKKIDHGRPWYMGKAIRQFGIHGGVEVKANRGIWEHIAKSIKKN